MKKTYEHTQIGYATLSLLALGIALVTFWLVVKGFTWLGFLLLVVLDLSLILFSTLTVVVRDGLLELTFGPGIYHKRITLSEVQHCDVTRNPWFFGWGIRWIPGGWLYNVSGLQAVVLLMRNGRQYRIGTDEPQKLLAAVKQALMFRPNTTAGAERSTSGSPYADAVISEK